MPPNVEEDFLAAFQRLSAGAPVHPELRARLAAGKKLTVNQSTVSLEAGHSRTLLSQRARGYERICKLLHSGEARLQPTCKNNRQSKSETSTERLERLGLEVKNLTHQRDQFATSLSEAYLALSIRDQELAALRAELKRRKMNASGFDDI